MTDEITDMTEVTLGFMGVHNSFSEKASKAFVEKNDLTPPSGLILVPLVDAFHVRNALLEKKIDLGVVAIKNSTSGMVAETAEAFDGVDVVVLDNFALPVHQCLFKRPGVSDDALTAVASHPQALMQTRNTRRKLFGELEERIMEDTSLSAKMLADGTLPANTAVVCSKDAGYMNGLELVRENIEDKPDNKTFFQLVRLPENKHLTQCLLQDLFGNSCKTYLEKVSPKN